MLLLALGCALNGPAKPDDTADSGDTADTGTGTPPTLPVVAACVVAAGSEPGDAPDDTVALTLTGTVTATGTGAPPTGCLDRAVWTGWATRDLDVALAVWLVLTDEDGVDWELAVTSGVFPDPAVLVGEPATIDWRSVLPSPFAGRAAETHARLTAPGFEGWVGVAGGVDTLTPPDGLTLSLGPIEATWSDECLDQTLYSLTGTMDATPRVAATGDTVGFGGLALWSGGVVVGNDPRCSETEPGYAAAITWAFP